MGSAERKFGDPMDLWRAQRDAEIVDSDPELADLISSGTLDSPWANLETGDIPSATEAIVSKLNSREARLGEIDG